ncbi:hypothetical protein, conserved [Leishmania tarentolae]|uniref:Glutaredoxin domain-containing protein n=1 Tax=Leishmania tarentolae TaxID=5689 RepID=A0A640KEE6_LEITA|nr:hypothetical protein, conserved [Leishmania tarentolae]
MLTMEQSSLYPSEHRSLRVLELACPGSDADLRENCAYLVSKRRMTIDEAIEYVRNEVEKEKSSRGTAITTTAPRLESATPVSAERSAAAAPATASTVSSSRPSVSYLPPPSCPRSRACEREGGDCGADSVGATYQGHGSARTRLSTTTEGTTTATRVVPTSSRSTTTLPSAGDSPNASCTQARSTAPRPCTQGASGLTATPPVAGTSPRVRMKPHRTHRVSDDTAVGVSESVAGAACLRSRGRLGQNNGGLRDLHEASAPTAGEGLNEASAPHVLAPPAVRSSGEPPTAASAARVPLVLKSGRGAYKDEDATATVTPPSTSTLPRRQLPPCTSAVPSPAYPNCLEGAVDKGAQRKATERRDADGGCCDAEPLLWKLKQTTKEERAAFESQQAAMLRFWYQDETSMFDHCLSRYGPGQVLFFMTSMTGERAVRNHCRLMENLLFIKLIPHHTIDIADSEFFHRRVRKLYTNATNKHNMPEMPLLFVDTKLIGDFVTVQELEDCGELDAKMIEAGCKVLRQSVVGAHER